MKDVISGDQIVCMIILQIERCTLKHQSTFPPIGHQLAVIYFLKMMNALFQLSNEERLQEL